MALYVEILPGSRMDDRGKELLQRIEDTFPTDGEFVCRISEAEFALAAPIGVYDYFLNPLIHTPDWLRTNYGGNLLSMKGGIALYRGLLPWTELDCWVFNTVPTRRAWYKGAIRREQGRSGIGTAVPVPIRFKHRFQTVGDNGFDRYDCYALDDYTPTHGVRYATMFDQFIYRFKQWHTLFGPFEPVRYVEHALRREETLAAGLPGAILSVIPAADYWDNQHRFKTFCRLLCEATGMENGFDAIEVEHSRRSMRGMTHTSKIHNLHMHYDRFEGRDVILFDDVYNTGTGFRQLADWLTRCGAASVTGVFLGRRIDPDDPPER